MHIQAERVSSYCTGLERVILILKIEVNMMIPMLRLTIGKYITYHKQEHGRKPLTKVVKIVNQIRGSELIVRIHQPRLLLEKF